MQIISIDLMYLCLRNKMNNIKYIIKRLLFLVSKFQNFREFMALYVEKRVLNENDAIKMKEYCKTFQECKLHFRLTDGTILGLYREGGFIKHDDDVDIDILNADKDSISLLKKKLKLKMKIGREVIYNGKIQQIAFYDKAGFIFDLVFWYGDDELIYNYCEKDYERVQESKFFQKNKLDFIDFKGEKYPMPTPIEEWLEMRYGADWKTPKTYKGDWKEECFDMKKMK